MLDWRALDTRARGVAGQLAAVAQPGDRAALLLPQGVDYAAAFLGCPYAGVIAVPMFHPDPPDHEGRLAAVLEDCAPVCALSGTATAPRITAFIEARSMSRMPVVCVDNPGGRSAPIAATANRPGPDDIAYLQYPSGSTRNPASVPVRRAGRRVGHGCRAVAGPHGLARMARSALRPSRGGFENGIHFHVACP
ncbi:AMP-binding protein [Streptomyces sp. HMX112]|uniref:AMP-binding protein n=1 Tax=Streptomyces sp. HMX112 TaxID=3390850 RepID=UPI003A802D0F